MSVTWSHSGLKDFENCAKRYHEVKILKNYPFTDTVHTTYGKDVHKAIEDYGKHGLPIPAPYVQFKPVVDAILAKPGRKLFEHEMGVTADLQPCDFNATNRWVRGIADYLAINDDNFTARCADWKTGNDKYPDRDQLVLMSLMTFVHFPHVKRVNSALIFLVKGSMVKYSMERDEAEGAWWNYRARVAKLEAATTNDIWPMNPTPLCGWCPVRACAHNTNRKGS